MRSLEFFETHPVFTHAEYVSAHTAKGRSPHTSNNLLSQHLARGRLIRVRRGLYSVVPRGVDPKLAVVDPYLVATHLSEDAAVSHHAALQFFGKSYSVWRRFHFATGRRSKAFSFRKMEFVPVLIPSSLSTRSEKEQGIKNAPHGGSQVRVTTLERSMVDVFKSPDKGGGWEEIWRSLEMIEYFDIDAVIDYVQALDSALTAARVGFYLEQHCDSLMLEARHLRPLEKLAPRQPCYLDSTRKSGKLVKRWNLIIPDQILNRRWEETG